MYTVYSKPQCHWCVRAKMLLKSKNLPFNELILDVGQPQVEGKTYVSVDQFKKDTAGASSVPQILHDGRMIGGYKELEQYIGGA